MGNSMLALGVAFILCGVLVKFNGPEKQSEELNKDENDLSKKENPPTIIQESGYYYVDDSVSVRVNGKAVGMSGDGLIGQELHNGDVVHVQKIVKRSYESEPDSLIVTDWISFDNSSNPRKVWRRVGDMMEIEIKIRRDHSFNRDPWPDIENCIPNGFQIVKGARRNFISVNDYQQFLNSPRLSHVRSIYVKAQIKEWSSEIIKSDKNRTEL